VNEPALHAAIERITPTTWTRRAHVSSCVAERLELFAFREGLLHLLARDLVREQQDLVDRVGPIIRRCLQHVALLEVDDLDGAVVFEANCSSELLPTQLDELFEQVDLADFAFELHHCKGLCINSSWSVAELLMR
jgi:hypothetical protein